MKKMLLRGLLLLAAWTIAGFASGCAGDKAEDSEIPWSQPASWEGQVPGMRAPGAY